MGSYISVSLSLEGEGRGEGVNVNPLIPAFSPTGEKE
jgi:hypothetical protein